MDVLEVILIFSGHQMGRKLTTHKLAFHSIYKVVSFISKIGIWFGFTRQHFMGRTELLKNLDLLNSLYQQLEGQLKQQ